MFHIVANVTPGRASETVRRGQFEFSDRSDKIDRYYTNEELAIGAAQQLAKEHPTQLFAVLTVSAVYETAEPKVIRKKVTADGELVVS